MKKMDKLYRHHFNTKIHLWERFLLLFKRTKYVEDDGLNCYCKLGFKKLFNNIYLVSETIKYKKIKTIEKVEKNEK